MNISDVWVRRPPRWFAALLAAGAAAVGVGLWPYMTDVLAVTGPQPEVGVRTSGRLVTAAVGWSFVFAGLVAWRGRPRRRIGRLLVLIGFVWLLHAFRNFDVPLLWTLGMPVEVASFPLIVYALLTFPDEGLRGWWRRGVVTLVAASPVTRALGLLVRGPEDGRNLLGFWEPELGYLVAELAGIGSLIVGLAALAVTLLVRLARATAPARRILAPVLVPGTTFAVAWSIYLSYQAYAGLTTRLFDPPTQLLQVLILVFIGSLATLPLGYLLGLARSQARRARVGEIARAADGDVVDGLQEALRRTLGDDSLVLAFPLDDGQRWVAADGATADLPAAGDSERAVTFLERRGSRIGAVVHDRALLEDDRLLESVTGIAALAVANERLAAEVQANLAEVRASRARIVAAGDEARRRIERDLHDGAQQRLLSAALALRSAQSTLERAEADRAEALLAEVSEEIAAGLSELRDLARGIHPAVLTDQGLAAALHGLASRLALSVEVTDVLDERLPAAVEAAAYFVASEALANAAKHSGAATARIGARRAGDRLVLVVADAGAGGATITTGGGLAGLADRVAALDGTLEVSSPAGGGTTVTASIPVCDG